MGYVRHQNNTILSNIRNHQFLDALDMPGVDPGLGEGVHLKKLRQTEAGAKIFGVFRVKNHDFTPKNHIFSNFRGGGACAGCGPPPGSAPACHQTLIVILMKNLLKSRLVV
jgi:hypothetical protein